MRGVYIITFIIMWLFWLIWELAKLPVSAAVSTLTCWMESITRDKEEPYVVSNVKNIAREFEDLF
jgi:hypothetical protein